MKTAKEMFEELGYKIVRDDEEFLDYETEEYYISFWKHKKIFYKVEYGYDAGDITMQELKAINKQVEELGWNK